MRCARFVVALVVLALIAPASGDILHLTDGSKLEGTLKREKGGWSVTDANGNVTTIPDEKVESVQKVLQMAVALYHWCYLPRKGIDQRSVSCSQRVVNC